MKYFFTKISIGVGISLSLLPAVQLHAESSQKFYGYNGQYQGRIDKDGKIYGRNGQLLGRISNGTQSANETPLPAVLEKDKTENPALSEAHQANEKYERTPSELVRLIPYQGLKK